MSIESFSYEQRKREKEIEEVSKHMAEKKREKEEREIQDTINLKRIADYNELILKLLSKDLTFINRALDKNNETDIQSQALLLELTKIIEEQDEKKLSDFKKQQGLLALATGLCGYIKNKLNLQI